MLGSRQEAVIFADLEVMIVRASLALSRAAALRLELTLVRMSSKADWSCRTCEFSAVRWRSGLNRVSADSQYGVIVMQYTALGVDAVLSQEASR